jgi:hypothetical protein
MEHEAFDSGSAVRKSHTFSCPSGHAPFMCVGCIAHVTFTGAHRRQTNACVASGFWYTVFQTYEYFRHAAPIQCTTTRKVLLIFCRFLENVPTITRLCALLINIILCSKSLTDTTGIQQDIQTFKKQQQKSINEKIQQKSVNEKIQQKRKTNLTITFTILTNFFGMTV